MWARVQFKFATVNFYFANLSDRVERPLQYEPRRSAVELPVVKYAGHICFEVKITCSIK